MSLDEKILQLKKKVSIMQKDAKGYGYDYVSEESILLAINDLMIKLKLRLTPKFVQGTLFSEVLNYKDAKGKDKTDVLVRSEMVFEWKDTETGETETIYWGLVGQQADASQALGSGLTYSNRYFLLKFFNISTSKDDPDAIRSKLQEAEERKRISSLQTKIKKLFEKLLQIYQSNDVTYEQLGMTREEFLEQYNNPETQQNLCEQLELKLKEGKKNVK